MTVLMEAKGLCRHFGALKAVHDVSFQVVEGEIFGTIEDCSSVIRLS